MKLQECWYVKLLTIIDLLIRQIINHHWPLLTKKTSINHIIDNHHLPLINHHWPWNDSWIICHEKTLIYYNLLLIDLPLILTNPYWPNIIMINHSPYQEKHAGVNSGPPHIFVESWNLPKVRHSTSSRPEIVAACELFCVSRILVAGVPSFLCMTSCPRIISWLSLTWRNCRKQTTNPWLIGLICLGPACAPLSTWRPFNSQRLVFVGSQGQLVTARSCSWTHLPPAAHRFRHRFRRFRGFDWCYMMLPCRSCTWSEDHNADILPLICGTEIITVFGARRSVQEESRHSRLARPFGPLAARVNWVKLLSYGRWSTTDGGTKPMVLGSWWIFALHHDCWIARVHNQI